MDQACVVKTRDLFHKIRDQEDYFAEFTYNVKALGPADLDFFSQPVPIYDRKFYPPYLVRSDLDDPKFNFQSGDLMLARGISFFSVIISQVSDSKSAFSHVVFVNKDAKANKVNTVESYIGAGVNRYDIDYALRNENARLLVLRLKDSALGTAAAVYAMGYAKQRLGYDYVMNYADYSKMSCVEVARAAYDRASSSKLLLPSVPANLNFKNQDFLNKMGLKNGKLITPDDLEVDSRFELVLDWRDYRLIRDSRHKDAVLSEFMRWMNDLGYNFHDTAKSVIAKDILLPARSTKLWPLIRKVTGVPDIDPLLPKKTLGIMTVMNQVATSVLEQLEKADSAYIAKYGRPMDNTQLREAVNLIRTNDLLVYKLGIRTHIHGAFRPSLNRW